MIDFKEIDNEDAANTVTEVFVGSVLDEKGLKVNVANDFFSQCLHNLENPSTSPKAKFYTIYVPHKRDRCSKNCRTKKQSPASSSDLFPSTPSTTTFKTWLSTSTPRRSLRRKERASSPQTRLLETTS